MYLTPSSLVIKYLRQNFRHDDVRIYIEKKKNLLFKGHAFKWGGTQCALDLHIL